MDNSSRIKTLCLPDDSSRLTEPTPTSPFINCQKIENSLQIKDEKRLCISTLENPARFNQIHSSGRIFPKEEYWKDDQDAGSHIKKLEPPYKCKICERKFSRLWYYERHLETFHREMEISVICTFCDKWFRNQKELEAHKIESHAEKRPFKCNHCSMSYERVKEIKLLRKHLMEFHGETKEGKAAAFNETFIKDRSKVRIVDPNTKRPCSECGQELENEISGIFHLLFNHYNQNCCLLCPEDFSSSNELKRHVEESGHAFDFCKTCLKGCKNISGLLKHMEHVHSPNITYPLICECCLKSFRLLSDLKMHYQRHFLKAGQTFYTCKNCHRSFLNSEELKRHKSSKICTAQSYNHPVIDNPQKTMCNICDKILFQANLDRHKVNTHQIKDKSVMYNCQECEFSCDSSTGLSVHRRTHFEYVHSEYVKKVYYEDGSDTKLFQYFKCIKCNDDQLFHKRNEISLHLYNQHEIILPGFKINPYGKQRKCNRCNKIVFQKEFRKHMAQHTQHTRILTFYCHLCPAELSGVGQMRTHFITIHPDSEQAAKAAKNDLRFQEDSKLRDMQPTRTQADIFCIYCKITFSSLPESDYHNKTVHKAQPVCKLCQQIFTDEISCKKHETTHKDFPCLPCNFIFSSMDDYCQHLQDKHKRYPYICEICGIYISTWDILMKHYEGKHTGCWKKKLTISSGRWAKLYFRRDNNIANWQKH